MKIWYNITISIIMATGTLFPFANLATGNVDNRWDCAMIHVQRQLIGLKHAEYDGG